MSGLNGPWLSDIDLDENEPTYPTDDQPEEAPILCDWCGIYEAEEGSAHCSDTCRAASRSDLMDFNPTWLERE